jgi:HEAT repeat protein
MFRPRFAFAAALLLGVAAVPRFAHAQFMGGATGSPLSPYGSMQQGSALAGLNDTHRQGAAKEESKILEDVRRGLKDADPSVRVQELKKLRYMHDPQANKILINSLADPDIRVRMKAIDLLGARGANDAVGPMSQLLFLRSTEPIVRLHVAAALGRIGDARGALPVIQYLQEQIDAGDDSQARGTAVFALGEIGSEKASRLLTQVANHDQSEMVRRLAQQALAKIDGEIPTQHATQLAQQKMMEPTDEKLNKLRAYDEKVQQMER